MKKLTFILMIGIFHAFPLMGQRLETIRINDDNFYKITLQNLQAMYNMQMANWEKEVASKEFGQHGWRGTMLVYQKGHRSTVMQTATKDTLNKVVTLNLYNFHGSERLTRELQEQLKMSLMYHRNESNYYRVRLNGTYYLVSIVFNDEVGMEEVSFGLYNLPSRK